jgi:hypothetical protein
VSAATRIAHANAHLKHLSMDPLLSLEAPHPAAQTLLV